MKMLSNNYLPICNGGVGVRGENAIQCCISHWFWVKWIFSSYAFNSTNDQENNLPWHYLEPVCCPILRPVDFKS